MTTTTTQMDIKAFLNLCIGNWFSQRTKYNLQGETTDSGKADLSITLIAPDDSRVTQFCQQERINPQQSIGGFAYSWDTSVDWGKPKQQGSSLMILIPDTDNTATGKVISNVAGVTGGKNIGTYVLGQDEALTLTIKNGDTEAEERMWFASDNLRLRSTVVKNGAGITHTTFYSEIRKAPPKEK